MNIFIYCFRPEKEGYELMRAALSQLRLLTLKMNQISLLAMYLLPEERTFLAGKLLFKDENSSDSAPPGLCANASPREKALIFTSLELIPKDRIITDHLKMGGKPLYWITDDREKSEVFNIDLIDLSRNLCLTGIEILTRGNNQPQIQRGLGNNSNR